MFFGNLKKNEKYVFSNTDPKVKWLNLTGEVNKSVTFHVQFCQDLTCQKSLKSDNF